MKKILTIVLALSVFAFSSCDDFLDKAPTNSGDASTAIQTARDAEVVMNGIMDGLLSSSYLGRNMFLYADTKGGDMTIKAQGRGSDALYVFNHHQNSGSYSGFWSTGYNLLLQINNLLENIEAIEATGGDGVENFDDYKAQALTLRAMLYFDLVRIYGECYDEDKSAWGVPDITTVLDASARELRATVEQNYARIVSDLTTAEGLFTDHDARNGFVSYYANKALQARVYLYMEDYDKALAAAQDVIGGPYELYDNDEWVASWSTQFGSESIFELIVLDTENDLGTGSLGGYYARAGDFGSVLGYFMASDYFLSKDGIDEKRGLGEDPTDIRWGIMTYDEISDTRMGCCYKYLGGVDQPGDGKASASAVNIKVIRLSEMYLIAAEAALLKPTSDPQAAADYLNEIRKRSPGLVPATASTINLDMILNERSKELYCEGHRFFDLMRCDKSITYNDEIAQLTPPTRSKTIDRSFFRTILPISQDEINANPDIEAQQNPGY